MLKSNLALLVADGFEEAEAIIVVDILRRLEICVSIIGIDKLNVTSYHDVKIECDCLLADCADKLFDGVIMAGGPQGAKAIGENVYAIEFIKRHIAASKLIGALCSSAGHVLAKNNLVTQNFYTTGKEIFEMYNCGNYIDKAVVIDKNLISGKGLGKTFDFALTVAARFVELNTVDWLAEHIFYSQFKCDNIKKYQV